ncbi:FMRFamide receptor [Biomphalaria glabrata]|nr:FMRFamide receptor-like [Biomphalaria glabrata]
MTTDTLLESFRVTCTPGDDVIILDNNSDVIDTYDASVVGEVIDDVTYSNLVLALVCVLPACILTLGTLGNIFNILTLSQLTMQDNTSIVLLSLSVVDLVYTSVKTFVSVSWIILTFDYYLGTYLINCYNVYVESVDVIAVNTSIHLVMFVSVERMIAVCFPFHVSKVLTPSRIRWCVLFIVIGNWVTRAPLFYTSYLGPVVRNNRTMYYPFTLDYINDSYSLNYIYEGVVIQLLHVFLPFAVISLCISATIFKIVLSFQLKQELSSEGARLKRKREIRSVKVVLCVCLLSLFFSLIPTFATAIFNAVHAYDIDDVMTFRQSALVFHVQSLLFHIHSSFNFIIYMSTNPKYRKTLHRVLCRKKNAK